jgi:mxaD protein
MIRKIVALVAMVGIGLFGADAAHAAASPQKVSESINIAAPPAKVWDIVKNFGDLGWHPAVKSTNATDGNTIGSTRTLDLGGPKLIEQLTKYDGAKMRYSYKITNDPSNVKTLPVTKYTSTITVKKGPKGSTTVTWDGRFLRADPSSTPAADQDDDAAIKAVTGVYRGGLDNLKKLAETK